MRSMAVEVRCDFCNYGGPFTEPRDFKAFPGGVDLCRWCATPAGAGGVLECGRHRIEITPETWTCSCGDEYERPLFIAARVLDALPSIVRATAYLHSETTQSAPIIGRAR